MDRKLGSQVRKTPRANGEVRRKPPFLAESSQVRRLVRANPLQRPQKTADLAGSQVRTPKGVSFFCELTRRGRGEVRGEA